MHRIIFLLNISIVCLLSGCVNKLELVKTQSQNLPAYNINNNFLKMTVIPESNGRISSLKYNGIELFLPYMEKRVIEDPLLPKVVFSNRSGWKEWLWGKSPLPNCSFALTGVEKNSDRISLDMKCRYFMAQDFYIEREIIMEKSSSAVKIKSTLHNIMDKKQSATLWISSIPNILPGKVETVFPLRGKISHIGRRSVKHFPENTIFILKESAAKNFFVAPAQAWLARVYPQQKLVMAFVTDMKYLLPDGLFYSWKGRNEQGLNINTMEMIFSPVSLNAGEKKTITSRIMVFKGLSGISTICGDVAIYCQKKADKKHINIKLILNSVKAYSDLRIKIFLTRKNKSKKLMQKTFNITNIFPGKNRVVNYSIPVNAGKGEFYISGIIDNQKFQIIKPVNIR